jgi:hypothetical protein
VGTHVARKPLRTLLTLFAVAVAVPAACSKEDKTGHRELVIPDAEMAEVVASNWGSGSTQLGRSVPDQAAPEGPKSFAVSANGTVYVLDAVNGRVLGYQNGFLTETTALPARPFVDIELDGTTGFALLDVDSVPSVVFVGFDGSVMAEVPISAEGEVPEAAAITALLSADDGWYVEVEGDYLVHVADASRVAVEEAAVPGQLVEDGAVLKLETSDGTFSIVKQKLAEDAEPERLTPVDIHFDQPLAERTLFVPKLGGGYLLAVQLFVEDEDPEKAGTSRHELVLLSAAGTELKRLLLPRAGGEEDSFRSVKQGNDGNVYVMTFSESGVDIGKVVLP